MPSSRLRLFRILACCFAALLIVACGAFWGGIPWPLNPVNLQATG